MMISVSTSYYSFWGSFFKVFPGHVVWHVGAILGVCNMLLAAAALRMDEHKARLRWTHRTEYGQRYRWRRIYYAVLPGFAAVDDPVDEHINLMPTTSSPGSASGHTPRGGVQESACEATLDA